jgi:hypothetical protein
MSQREYKEQEYKWGTYADDTQVDSKKLAEVMGNQPPRRMTDKLSPNAASGIVLGSIVVMGLVTTYYTGDLQRFFSPKPTPAPVTTPAPNSEPVAKDTGARALSPSEQWVERVRKAGVQIKGRYGKTKRKKIADALLEAEGRAIGEAESLVGYAAEVSDPDTIPTDPEARARVSNTAGEMMRQELTKRYTAKVRQKYKISEEEADAILYEMAGREPTL